MTPRGLIVALAANEARGAATVAATQAHWAKLIPGDHPFAVMLIAWAVALFFILGFCRVVKGADRED